MRETEKDIEKYLVDRVREMGGRAYKFASPGNDGVPDRIIVFPEGLITFVELKAEGGRLSTLQRAQLGRLEMLGCAVYVAWSRADVDTLLFDCEKRRLGYEVCATPISEIRH